MTARKPMTRTERLIGRRKPPEPSHFTSLMAGFVRKDGTFCGRSNPSDRWMIPAFTKARKEGLIRRGIALSFGGRVGKSDGVWYLTEKGEKVATEMAALHARMREAVNEWGRDAVKAFREQASGAREIGNEAPSQAPREGDEPDPSP